MSVRPELCLHVQATGSPLVLSMDLRPQAAGSSPMLQCIEEMAPGQLVDEVRSQTIVTNLQAAPRRRCTGMTELVGNLLSIDTIVFEERKRRLEPWGLGCILARSLLPVHQEAMKSDGMLDCKTFPLRWKMSSGDSNVLTSCIDLREGYQVVVI